MSPFVNNNDNKESTHCLCLSVYPLYIVYDFSCLAKRLLSSVSLVFSKFKSCLCCVVNYDLHYIIYIMDGSSFSFASEMNESFFESVWTIKCDLLMVPLIMVFFVDVVQTGSAIVSVMGWVANVMCGTILVVSDVQIKCIMVSARSTK